MATGNYVEVEADRKAAEDSGCAVNLKSNQQSPADHAGIQSEAPKSSEEDVGRRRGQGHNWGRGRPRASRFRPGHYGQGSLRDNHATESDMLEDKDSEKRLSPSYTGHEKHLPSGDWDTGPHSCSSASHSLESQSRPPNGGQRSRESSRGQRVMTGRGHSRGPFAKFVTVPDASHSHDVRHVEEVNNSIVINIDRSTRLGGDSMRRGGRGTGGGGGYSTQSIPTGELLEDSANAGDQESGLLPSSDNAQHQKSGFQGQGRRPFRGRGDGSFRGRGENFLRGQGQGRGDKFRRGRGDGPRPFRGGYRADRPRGGRTSRRAIIVTSKSEREDCSQQVPEPEDWDKTVPAAAIEAGVIDGHGWTNTEDGSANWDEGEGNQDPGRSVVFDCGHSFKESQKELDLHEDEAVAHQDQPKKLEHHHTVEKKSEDRSNGMGDKQKTDLANKDESISSPAEHSPSFPKLQETLSAVPMEAKKGDMGIQDVETLTENTCENVSALPVGATKGGLEIHDVEKLTDKPCKPAFPVEAKKGDFGIQDVEKITNLPCETLSALPVEATKGDMGMQTVEKSKENSTFNTETNVDYSKPHRLNTISKTAEIENRSSCNDSSHELVPEKVAEAANGESKDAIKPCSHVEVAGCVDVSTRKDDSLLLVPEKAVGTDSKRCDQEMAASKPVPSASAAAAAECAETSIKQETAANVLIGESISAEPQSRDIGFVEKSSAVSSEIPASVKENT